MRGASSLYAYARTTQAHARTRKSHASCVMRAQQRPLLLPSSPRSKHHPCCSSTMMIMMISCSTCVCVCYHHPIHEGMHPRLALPSRDVSSSPCLLGFIAAYCSLLLLLCLFILSFVVLLSSLFSLFPLS